MAVEDSVRVSIVPFERNHKPNTDGDIRSLVRRIVAVEDKIDAENKLKALIYAEAKVSGVDIGALKATVRAVRYMPLSNASTLDALSDTVKRYLDLATSKVSSAHKNSED